MTSVSKINCFGIQISGMTADEVIRAFESHRQQGPFFIVTANPEILLNARRNEEYRHALQSSNVAICDSFGLKIAGFLQGKNMRRLTGVDLSDALIGYASNHQLSVGLIGGYDDTATKACDVVHQRYPKLICMSERGGRVDEQGAGDAANDEAIHRLQLQSPDILLVGLGGNEKQEIWIYRNMNAFPTLKFIMGVGGTLDYWSGIKRRAPLFLRYLGLEWLYRLIREPRRFRRILNAVFVFPTLYLFDLIRRRHGSGQQA